MRVRWALGCLVFFALQAHADSSSSAPLFSVIPSAVASQLRGKQTQPAGATVLQAAEADLTREPHAVRHLHTEGLLPHQGLYDQSVEASKDFTRLLNFGLAYQMTGDRKFLNAADHFFNVWIDTYQVSGNPIDETSFDRIFLAYDLTRADLPPSTQQKFDAFAQSLTDSLTESLKHEKKEEASNWECHRIKLMTLAAFALGSRALISSARSAFQHEVSTAIEPSGSLSDFEKHDALYYVVYDLEPLVFSALAAKEHGEDWFHDASEDGSSLSGAVEWLVPYAAKRQTHEEFTRSTVHIDQLRKQAGLKGFSGLWDPASCAYLFSITSLVDRSYRMLAGQIARLPNAQLPSWVLLLKETNL